MSKESIKIVRDHNKWRRGKIMPMVDVKTLGIAIDEVCNMAEKYIALHSAAIETLNENAHLADGDNCTLLKLKKAVGDWE